MPAGHAMFAIITRHARLCYADAAMSRRHAALMLMLMLLRRHDFFLRHVSLFDADAFSCC